MGVTRILLVGGPEDVRKDLEPHLAAHDCVVIDQWPYRKKLPRALPREAEMVLLLTDMCSHKLANGAKELAQAAQVPFIYGTRKWSRTGPMIEAALARRSA
jgi:hypothetical protein